MNCAEVTTQGALDAALADDNTTCIHITSGRGVWLTLSDNRGKSVELRGNSSAELRENSSARLRGNSSARLRGNSSAELRENSSAELRENSSARLRENSSAELRENSSAAAAASTSLHAYDLSRVTAGAHVAVHLHSAQAAVTGGTLIDLTALDLDDPATWADHHGVDVNDGTAVLYKALDAELTAGADWGRPTVYTVGSTVTAVDWRDDNACGGGLHFSPTASQATDYRENAKRWVRVEVPLAELRPIQGGTAKCKSKSCTVVAEVDRFGRDLPAPAMTGFV